MRKAYYKISLEQLEVNKWYRDLLLRKMNNV